MSVPIWIVPVFAPEYHELCGDCKSNIPFRTRLIRRTVSARLYIFTYCVFFVRASAFCSLKRRVALISHAFRPPLPLFSSLRTPRTSPLLLPYLAWSVPSRENPDPLTAPGLHQPYSSWAPGIGVIPYVSDPSVLDRAPCLH